jgi:hypothetical protein
MRVRGIKKDRRRKEISSRSYPGGGRLREEWE